jgi:hypothetical protein
LPTSGLPDHAVGPIPAIVAPPRLLPSVEGDTLVVDTVGVKTGPFAIVDICGALSVRLCLGAVV